MEELELSRTKSKRRIKIVETAYEMFIENGISSTSMNDVAEQCGITRRTIYNYFESKNDLLNYLMLEKTEKVDPDFHLTFDESLSGVENLRKVLQINFESYYKHMKDFLFITQVRTELSYRLNKRLNDPRSYKMHQAFISEIEEVIKRGQDDGTIKKLDLDPHSIARMLYQSLYGYLSNITIGVEVEKEKYDRKCKDFEFMIVEFLESK
ncbi:MAG: TetR/AcrR family transcriptional regulator [Erysipelotrichales bacterium]